MATKPRMTAYVKPKRSKALPQAKPTPRIPKGADASMMMARPARRVGGGMEG